jgi:hypothetical protein
MRTRAYSVPAILGYLALLFCAGAAWAQPTPARGARPARVRLYQLVEETMTNDGQFGNPFTDTELRLQVAAPARRQLGRSFTWYGFYDGDGKGGQTGDVWKLRLLFDCPGQWTVSAGFYAPGTNTPNGPARTFAYRVSTSAVPDEHGHVYVDPQNWRRLRCADGTPWVPFVMCSSMLLDRDAPIARRWIDEHAARGVEALAVRFHAEAWTLGDAGHWHFLLKDGRAATEWPGSADAFDYTRFCIPTWHYNEQMIQYAHAKGVKLSIWFGISGINRQYWSCGPKDSPDDAHLGPQQSLFIRYFLARWAPYTTWWHWTVDSEYEETGRGALERIRAYAAELRARNPWRTLITTHVLRDWTPQDAPEFDIATLQQRVADTDAGATDAREFIVRNAAYGRPVFDAEGVWNLPIPRMRVATWALLMAGGFSEVAYYPAEDDNTASSWGVNWEKVDGRHREAAAELGKMARFFNHTKGIDIRRCVPHDDLVTLRSGHLALCLADPGRSYYVWLDQGGEAALDLSGEAGRFLVTRYRCTELDRPAKPTPISGGGKRSLGETPTSGFDNGYLFVVRSAR